MSKPKPRESAQEGDAEVIPLHAPLTVTLDGERVVIDAAEELVLRCGKARIVLRSNGRVLIEGARVETSAEGVNRIKGGSVQIN